MEIQNVEQLLEKISEQVKSMVKTETVIGDEFKLGEYTCKPVVRVGLGYGSGSGKGTSDSKFKKHNSGHGDGVGAGAGLGILPVGFLATKGDEIKFIPAGSKNGLNTLFEKIPDIVEKFADSETKKEESK